MRRNIDELLMLHRHFNFLTRGECWLLHRLILNTEQNESALFAVEDMSKEFGVSRSWLRNALGTLVDKKILLKQEAIPLPVGGKRPAIYRLNPEHSSRLSVLLNKVDRPFSVYDDVLAALRLDVRKIFPVQIGTQTHLLTYCRRLLLSAFVSRANNFGIILDASARDLARLTGLEINSVRKYMKLFKACGFFKTVELDSDSKRSELKVKNVYQLTLLSESGQKQFEDSLRYRMTSTDYIWAPNAYQSLWYAFSDQELRRLLLKAVSRASPPVSILKRLPERIRYVIFQLAARLLLRFSVANDESGVSAGIINFKAALSEILGHFCNLVVLSKGDERSVKKFVDDCLSPESTSEDVISRLAGDGRNTLRLLVHYSIFVYEIAHLVYRSLRGKWAAALHEKAFVDIQFELLGSVSVSYPYKNGTAFNLVDSRLLISAIGQRSEQLSGNAAHDERSASGASLPSSELHLDIEYLKGPADPNNEAQMRKLEEIGFPLLNLEHLLVFSPEAIDGGDASKS